MDFHALQKDLSSEQLWAGHRLSTAWSLRMVVDFLVVEYNRILSLTC